MVECGGDDQAESLEAHWQAILKHSSQGSPFLTWAWHQAMLTQYSRRMEPFFVAVWDGPRLVALAPLAWTSRKWGVSMCGFLGGGPWRYSMVDFQDILVAPGQEAVGLREIVTQLKHSLNRWDIVDLKEVPEDSPVMNGLLAEAHSQGLRTLVEPMGSRHVIFLPPSWEAYLCQLPKNMKQSLPRKMRKLAREHDVYCTVASSKPDVDTYMGYLERLHTARWRQRRCPGIFARQGVQEFHRDIAHQFFEQGMLDLMVLWMDGEPVAVNYNFRLGETLYNYASGFDTRPELGKYSLGTVINGLMIQRAIQEGISRIDLLRGDQHYKVHYGATPQQNFRILIFRTRQAHVGYVMARRIRRWIKPVKARVIP